MPRRSLYLTTSLDLALEAEAKRRRMATGEECSVADLLREGAAKVVAVVVRPSGRGTGRKYVPDPDA